MTCPLGRRAACNASRNDAGLPAGRGPANCPGVDTPSRWDRRGSGWRVMRRCSGADCGQGQRNGQTSAWRPRSSPARSQRAAMPVSRGRRARRRLLGRRGRSGGATRARRALDVEARTAAPARRPTRPFTQRLIGPTGSFEPSRYAERRGGRPPRRRQPTDGWRPRTDATLRQFRDGRRPTADTSRTSRPPAGLGRSRRSAPSENADPHLQPEQAAGTTRARRSGWRPWSRACSATAARQAQLRLGARARARRSPSSSRRNFWHLVELKGFHGHPERSVGRGSGVGRRMRCGAESER